MRYGLPYQGSKNDIAQWVIDHLPPADVLIDAFAGGCAITHCAMLSHKFKRVIANDINDIPSLFVDAIKGKYRNETRWISREDFFALKDTDPYVRLCWSFGNDGKTYMYSKEIEPYKKAFHYALIFQDYSLWEDMGINVPNYIRAKCKRGKTSEDRRAILRKWIIQNSQDIRQSLGLNTSTDGLRNLQSEINRENVYRIGCEQMYRLMNLGRLQGMERLQGIERLRGMKRLQGKLTIIQGDYATISLPQGESYVIYCDPPYKNTDCGHYKGFDHERFYEWLRSQSVPVVVSEYKMPSDFREVDVVTKQVKLNSDGSTKGAERLFCHESTIDKLPKTTLF